MRYAETSWTPALFSVFILVMASIIFVSTVGTDEAFGSIAFEDDKRVDSDTTGSEQNRPSILVSGNDVYVFWQDQRNGNWDIYSRTSHNGGLSFGTEVRVDDTSRTTTLADDISEQMVPRAAIGPDDDIYVVWEDERLGKPMIYYAISTDRGASFGSNMVLSDSVIGKQRSPDIDASPSGDIHVVWEDNRDSMGNYQIYSSCLPSSGSVFTDAVRVSDVSTQYECRDPAISAPVDDRVHIVWNDNRVWDEDVYIATSRNGGQSFGSSIRVSADPTGSDQIDPEIAADETSVYVIWSDPRTNSADIYYVVSLDNATTFSVNRIMNPRNNSGHQYEPRAAIDDVGNLTVCWTSSPGMTDKRSDVQMTRLAWNGTLEEVYTVNAPVKDVIQSQGDVAVNDKDGSFFVWVDNRNSGDKDIYYTRTTMSGEEGFAPSFLDFEVTPEIGGIGTKFTFKANYMDPENDAPAPGYPKVNLYYLSAGNALYPFPGSPFNMTRRLYPDPPDYNYYNGEVYMVSINVDRELDLFYSVSAKAASGNSTIVRTEILNMPVIDGSGPEFQILAPEEGRWIRDNIIPFSVLIYDELSGVEPWSVFYQKYQDETNGWGPWQRKGTSVSVDNHTLLYTVNVTFLEGDQGLIRFRAMDRTQFESNTPRYSVSQDHNVWVDPNGPRVDVLSPGSGTINNNTEVSFRVYLEDLASGVDVDSVEVSCSLNGVDGFGLWMNLSEVRGTIEEGDDGYIVDLNLSLGYGFYNYVRFRASDILGNIGVSSNVQVIVQKEGIDDSSDKPPTKVESIQPRITGSIRPHMTWTPSFDPEGGFVTYNMSIYDSYTDEYLVEMFQVTPGYTYWDPSLEQLFKAGHTYLVTIIPSSGGLNGPETVSTLLVSTDANSPPDPVTNFTPRATSDTTPLLSWDPVTDPDGDEVYYFLRIGRYSSGSDILDWTSVLSKTRYAVQKQLTPGTYHVDIFSSDGKDFAPISYFTVSIGIYNPVLDLQRAQVVVYQGSGATINLTINNKGFTFDHIKVRVDGEALDRLDMDFMIGEDIIDLAPGSRTNTTFHVDAKEDAKLGVYSLNITLISVDGISVYTKGISIRVVDPDDPIGGMTPTVIDNDENDDTFVLLILFIVLLLVIIGAMGYAYYRIDRREKVEEVEVIEKTKGTGLKSRKKDGLRSRKKEEGKALPPGK